MSFSGSYTAAALNTELTTDPKSLGYATWIPVQSIGGNNNICNLLNQLTGNGAATINMTTMTAAQIAAIMLPLFGSATTLTAIKYAYYTLIFSMIMAQQGPIVVSGLANFSLQMISDGIMTGAQASALGQRIGSRAETLWGQGTTVSEQDVETALGEGF
jgi:hypothetical protein